MAFKQLSPVEVSKLEYILQAGISNMTYNMVAQYLVPRGFGWAAATGYARRFVPEFSGIDFAKQWYRPYQVERQRRDAVTRGIFELIPEKDMIEHSLKQNTRYMYNVSYEVLDDDGNFIMKSTRSYYSDDKLTPEDVQEKCEQVFKSRYEEKGLVLGNFEFVAMYHNEGWNY